MNGIIAGCVLITGLFFVGSESLVRAEAPPNDDFNHRIRVAGEDILLQADMAESSLEQVYLFGDEQGLTESAFNTQDIDYAVWDPVRPIGSVWWSWVAPRSGTVVIMPPADPLDVVGDARWFPPTLNCFRLPDPMPADYLLRLASEEYSVDHTRRGFGTPRYPYAGFYVIQGTQYLLQARGFATGSFTFRLLMPGGPFVSESPLDKTLQAGESTFLHVIATGSPLNVDLSLTPIHYQWLHDGVEITGETYPTLALNSVTAQHAGNYQVIVSDREGSVTSKVARVEVTLKEVPPSLAFSFPTRERGFKTGSPIWSLKGEKGRYYVLESSTNLVDWQWQAVDAVSPVAEEPFTTTAFLSPDSRPAHVRLRGEPFEFQPRTSAATLFLRARRVTPFSSERSAALWVLEQAKEDWGRDTRLHQYLWSSPLNDADIARRLSVELWPTLFREQNDCQGGVILGGLGRMATWTCTPVEPSLWEPDAYYTENPPRVWNLAR